MKSRTVIWIIAIIIVSLIVGFIAGASYTNFYASENSNINLKPTGNGLRQAST